MIHMFLLDQRNSNMASIHLFNWLVCQIRKTLIILNCGISVRNWKTWRKQWESASSVKIHQRTQIFINLELEKGTYWFSVQMESLTICLKMKSYTLLRLLQKTMVKLKWQLMCFQDRLLRQLSQNQNKTILELLLILKKLRQF